MDRSLATCGGQVALKGINTASTDKVFTIVLCLQQTELGLRNSVAYLGKPTMKRCQRLPEF